MSLLTYKETLDFLFTQLPMFQNIGAGAYKPGLGTIIELENAFGNSHRQFATIHVAGTNGKGSTSHSLASVLQKAGYRVGLFTSPHLIDFRERIKVNGEMISQEQVIDFVARFREKHLQAAPSFFELTTVMAFEHFARERVDIAVIEVGLGGRLDSTNIITPEISVITNISKDHVALLGDTLPKIAAEKAGIIKPSIPVVIGEVGSDDVKQVFVDKANAENAPIIFAEEQNCFSSIENNEIYHDTPFGAIKAALTGDCQSKNMATVITTLLQLRKLGWKISDENVQQGLSQVVTLTGLMGRWMTVSDSPRVICDTGHNEGGWQYLAPRLATIAPNLVMVIGFVNDKDIDHILALMPRNARYIFVQASVSRALPSNELMKRAQLVGLQGVSVASVEEGYKKALEITSKGDTIFVGGSTFVVADLLRTLKG
jgi:dihydrofolate synthase/folylpolyglutamate synthase